jgi:RNA polymerase sigma-70 factor (ECF subfamily)
LSREQDSPACTDPTANEARQSGVALEGLDEAALVQACVDGNPGAFDIVVARHRRQVYQLCYRFAGNAEDASDLAQEVFLRAYRAIGKFKAQASLGTWLHRIAVNVCLNRRAGVQPRLEPLDDHRELSAPGPGVLGNMLSEERAARVRAAIARLPGKQRAALILRVYQELPHQEIAAILGTTEGTAKANVFHALKNLRKLLTR